LTSVPPDRQSDSAIMATAKPVAVASPSDRPCQLRCSLPPCANQTDSVR
jgi:hypothetical protein